MELIFNNANEEKMYQKYKLLKGEEYHFYVAEQIGSNQYSDVAAAIQYDLKLKYILYRYVSFFEEGLRAIIMNCDIKDIDFFLDNRVSMNDIQHLYFKNIFTIVNTYPTINIISQVEFNGIRDLRNDISHFKPLIFEKYDISLANIKKLELVLPKHYAANFKNEINLCEPDLPLLPNLKIKI